MAFGPTLGLAFLALSGASLLWRKIARRRFLLELRRSWGQEKKDIRFRGELDEIAAFHLKRRSLSPGFALDDRTWRDLDMDSVFRKLDRTESVVGRQLLYDVLRRPLVDTSELAERDRLATLLSENVALREEVQLQLASLCDRSTFVTLSELFLGDLPQRPRWFLLIPTLTLVAGSAVALTFAFPGALPLLIGIAVFNIWLRLSYRRSITGLVQSLPGLRTLLKAGRSLRQIARGKSALSPIVTELDDCLAALAPLEWSTSWLVIEKAKTDDLTWLIYEYVNILFLLDLNAFVFSLDLLRSRRESLERLFFLVGSLDVAVSIASLRVKRNGSATCRPKFLPRARRATFRGLVHPLLESPVANDLELTGMSLLVTGSNMSGKTTFIKTVGVNVILAQTLHTCFAKEYLAPVLAVRSSIGLADDLIHGRSYYLAEVEALREAMEAMETGPQFLFILDEILRGTNTPERMAASKAILEHLTRRLDHIVLASTHDLELVPLLGLDFEAYHFKETLEGGNLLFDFKLHPGPSPTRNAIAILAQRGFPAEVVQEALRLVGESESGPPELRRAAGVNRKEA
jgi:DNA mismatch repair ATPase MutS